MQVPSSGSSVKVLIIDTSTNADLFFNLEEWLVLQPRPRDQAIQTLLVHGLHAAKTILPASPTLATLNKELSAVAYSLKLEKVRLADALELEKVRLADALKLEKERLEDDLQLEKARLADDLQLEKTRLADDLQLEKTRFADALEKERRDSVVAVQRERSALSSVLEMRVRAGIAEGCAEERVQLRNVEANLASLRDREIEKEVARKTDDTKALRMQLADLEREMDILRRSNSARGAVGEERIASFLRREWPTSEVRDMSKSPHTCDIWWFASPSSFIAVEVKNKGVVTRSDVERFESDVANISERNGRAFIGGVFVSCRSENIPDKGPLKLVMMPGRGGVSIPIIFAGFTDCKDEDLVWLKGVLHVFMTVAQYEQNKDSSTNSISDVEDRNKIKRQVVFAKLSQMVEHVGRIRSFVHNVRTTHLAAALNLTSKADDELRELFSNITDVFVVLTLFVGMALIIHGIYEEKFLEMNKNVRVEYRFLPRTLYEEQLSKQDPALTAKFKNMFQEDSPWK
eukprot:gene29980-18052_t